MTGRVAAALVFYAVFVAGIYLLALRPFTREKLDLQAERRQQEDLLVQVPGVAVESEPAKQLRLQAAAYIDSFKGRVLPSRSTEIVLGELNSLCRECGVTLAGLMADEETKGRKVAAYDKSYWKVGLIGPYHAIGIFMNRLENARCFMGVEDFTLSTAKEGAGLVEARFAVYTLKEQEVKPAGDSHGS